MTANKRFERDAPRPTAAFASDLAMLEIGLIVTSSEEPLW